jgi:hypothetical protein
LEDHVLAEDINTTKKDREASAKSGPYEKAEKIKKAYALKSLHQDEGQKSCIKNGSNGLN